MKKNLILLLFILQFIKAAHESPFKTRLLESPQGYTLRTLLITLKNNATLTHESSQIKQTIINRITVDFDFKSGLNLIIFKDVFYNYLVYLLNRYENLLIVLKENNKQYIIVKAFIEHIKDLISSDALKK